MQWSCVLHILYVYDEAFDSILLEQCTAAEPAAEPAAVCSVQFSSEDFINPRGQFISTAHPIHERK